MSQLTYWNYVTFNKDAIKNSLSCGCIYCKRKFDAKLVKDFTPDKCGLCPFCYVDALVPDSLIGFTDDQLNQWHKEGFSSSN